MDHNAHHESPKEDVTSPSDNSKAATKASNISIGTTTTTTTTTKKLTLKTDPMIIPTSAKCVNGDASPSPSKRMRYELFISTPLNDDRKSTPLSPKGGLADPESIRFPPKKVTRSNDDSANDERDDRGLLHDKSSEGDGNDFRAAESRPNVARDGIRRLDNAEHARAEIISGVSSTDETCTATAPLRINAVLPERYTRPVSLSKVLVAKIFDRTKSAIFLQAICQEFRLPESLNHLKRVKSEKKTNENGKSEVILHVIVRNIPAFSDTENDAVVAQRYFAESLSALTASSAGDLSSHLSSLGSPYLAQVSDSPPLTREQYDAARAHWPCTFHEDKRISSLIDGRFFCESEASVVRANLMRTLRVTEEAKKQYGLNGVCDACVIVDPKDNAVIAVAHDLSKFDPVDLEYRGDKVLASWISSPSSDKRSFKIRPYYHAPMVAIDLVAASQGGGAYAIPMDKFPLMSYTSSFDATSPDIENQENDANEDSNSSNVTYLCTGFDVYLSKEPCLMCAMSLIHSRIRRLFYRHRSADGALGSKFSIHTLESLNHHFEAFCLE